MQVLKLGSKRFVLVDTVGSTELKSVEVETRRN